MIRLSRITDYGIVLMVQLARDTGGEARNSRHLAAEAGLPAPVVSKVLKSLARAGLLESQRGSKGGYALARVAADISVPEMITALEGPISLTECTLHPGACSPSRKVVSKMIRCSLSLIGWLSRRRVRR